MIEVKNHFDVARQVPSGDIAEQHRRSYFIAADTDRDPDALRAQEHERTLKLTDFNYGLHEDEDGAALSTGRRRDGMSATKTAQIFAARKTGKKSKDDALLDYLLLQLEDRLAALDAEIAQILKEVEALRQEVADLEETLEARYGADWQARLARGELDDDPQAQRWKERNTELLQKEQQLQALKAEREDTYARYIALREQHLDLAGATRSSGADYDRLKSWFREQTQGQFEQVNLEGTAGISSSEKRIVKDQERASVSSVDNEIEQFMRNLAQAQQIEDQSARLAREKELVEGLSPQAAEVASFEESTEYLFGEGYFDSLGQTPRTTQSRDSVKPIGPSA